ncbi:hypothetical protein BKA70DRAFT_1245479 [Coprinopsis sp. MPI-PUGE-AT-0042]|nr:hypothetical protein BKA70DRAFT_1245479 [Coprinopsis sp. MPI-PUGE-AT-0042]
MAGIKAIGQRSKGPKSRLVLISPGFSYLGGDDYARKQWQSILQIVFNRNSKGHIPINVAELHLLPPTEGLEAIDLRQVEAVTFEGDVELEDFETEDSVEVQWKPKKIIMLEHDLSSSGPLICPLFGHVVDLAIFESAEPSPDTIHELLDSLGYLAELTSLRIHLPGTTFATQPPAHDTLTLPHLRYLELYDCEQTCISCLPFIRFSALEHLDWIVLVYQPAKSYTEILSTLDAPHLHITRACYIQSSLITHPKDLANCKPTFLSTTQSAAQFRSWGESVVATNTNPTAFLSSFTLCRRLFRHNNRYYRPKRALASSKTLHSILLSEAGTGGITLRLGLVRCRQTESPLISRQPLPQRYPQGFWEPGNQGVLSVLDVIVGYST